MIDMKRYLILGALAFLVLTGCDDKLNLAPYQSIDQTKALSTEKDVRVTLIGAYDGMQSATTYGGDMMVLSELIGNREDILFTGTFAGLSDIYNIEMVATNSNAAGTWNAAYNVINRANNVLAGVDKVTSSAANKNRIEGEALFIRASMYFELVRMYGKAWDDGNNTTNPGVPLVLQPTTSVTEADFRARNTVAEVYAQIITDLEKAESLLPVTNSIYATKNAAAAQLSRVFLMQGATGSSAAQLAALQKARDAADRVIQSNRHPLTTTFPALWFTFMTNAGNSPAEYIFSMKVTTQDGTNALNTYFGTNAGPGTAGRSDCKITDAHRDKYETGDVRKDFYVIVGGRNYTRKHLDRFGNVPIVRSAEMYLTRAEANLRLGASVGDTPLNDVNRIRTRAGLAALVNAPTVADVVKERYLELAHEGSRIHDIKRTRGNASGVAWNDPRLIFPIPQREMDTNSNLTQNVGYEN
jgi:starch-binding outer membrane protein, SusD/RagB family